MSMAKLREYYDAARTLASERGSTVLREALGVLRYRVHAGKGPPLYLTYRLFDVQPSLWSEYMDNRERWDLQQRVNDKDHFHLADDKLAFHGHCRAHGIRTPDLLAVVGGSPDAAAGHRHVSSASEFLGFLSEVGPADLVFKLAHGTRGEGFHSSRWDGRHLLSLADGQRTTPADFYARLEGASDTYLVQPRLRAHRLLAPVMSGEGLGTVRIVSYVTRDRQTLVPWAYIRLPITGSVSDNFAHGASGNLLANVDVETGRLGPGFARRPGRSLIDRFEAHPETHERIVGREVPRWDTVVELCRTAAQHFPGLRTIGWDIAITDDGLYVIEANKTYDIDVHQIALQRGLRRELTELYAR